MALARRALVLALLLLPFGPAAASAGSYDVWSCNLPDGTNLPVEGWTPQQYGTNAYTYNGCSHFVFDRDGGLAGGFKGDTHTGQNARWIFNAPADTMITRYTLWRVAHAVSSAYAFQDFTLSDEIPGSLDSRYLAEFCSVFVSCSSLGDGKDPLADGNRYNRANLQIRRITASMSCRVEDGGTHCDSSRDTGDFTIYSARVALEDLYRPEFSAAPSGSLLTTGVTLDGEKTISIAASDRGGGIEKLGIAVDGLLRQAQLADASSVRCRRPFSALRPCSPKAEATLVFDTAQLANGTHTIQAAVIDAGGNETRSDPVTVTTRNHSQPNGRGASRFVKLSAWLRSKRDAARTSAVVPYGSVRFAEGRLTDANGSPIAGACSPPRAGCSGPVRATSLPAP